MRRMGGETRGGVQLKVGCQGLEKEKEEDEMMHAHLHRCPALRGLASDSVLDRAAWHAERDRESEERGR